MDRHGVDCVIALLTIPRPRLGLRRAGFEPSPPNFTVIAVQVLVENKFLKAALSTAKDPLIVERSLKLDCGQISCFFHMQGFTDAPKIELEISAGALNGAGHRVFNLDVADDLS